MSKIAILGIERDNVGINHAQGSCNELVNLHHNNGAWVPSVVGEEVEDLGAEIIYHHPALEGGYVYATRPTGGGTLSLSVKKSDGSVSTFLTFSTSESIKSMQHIGNMLYLHILSSSDTKVVRLLWDGVKYVDLSGLPDAPEITGWDYYSFSFPTVGLADGVTVLKEKSVGSYLDNRIYDPIRDIEYTLFYPNIDLDGTNIHNGLRTFIRSYILKFDISSADDYNTKFNSQLALFKAKGFYNGIFSVVLCYELYDGTIVKYGNPKLMYCPGLPIEDDGTTVTIYSKFSYRDADEVIKFNHISTPGYDGDTLNSATCEFQGYKHRIEFAYNIPLQYKDIVKTIVLCASPLRWDDYNYYMEEGTSDLNDIKLSDELTMNDYFTNESFYVLKRFSANYGSNQVERFQFEYKHFDNIRNGEALPIDVNQSNLDIHLSRSGKFSVYNKRMLLNGVSFKFPEFDYNQLDLIDDIGTTLYVIIQLSVDNAPLHIISAILDKNVTLDTINILAYYPDSRAQRISIYSKEDGVNYLRLEESMSTYGNYAYVYGSFIDQKGGPQLLDSYFEYQRLLEQNDTLRISKTNNPFVFSVLDSFTFDGDILGSAAATHATSDGQFGQFPLNVFHKAGINALEVGSGDIAFSRDIPLSREVCSNAASIHGSEIGILFVDEDGLKLLNGRDIILLTDKVDAAPDIGIREDGNYQLFTGESGPAEMLSRFPVIHPLLSTDNIIDYLQGALVKYLGTKNKLIIISNPAKSYSYIISLAQSMIYKVERSYKCIENSYPEVYALDDVKLYKLSEVIEHSTSVFIETNPMSLQEYDWSISRLIVRGLLDCTHATLVSGVYVYGSMDEKTWTKLNHYQINTKRKDVAISFTGGQFKWLKVVFSGWLNQGSYISHIEFIPVPKGKDNIS